MEDLIKVIAHWDELYILQGVLESHDVERRRQIKIHAEALCLAMEET